MRGLRCAAAGRLNLIIYGITSIGTFNQIGSTYAFDQLGYDPSGLDGTISFFGGTGLCDYLVSKHRSGHPCILVQRYGEGVPSIVCDDEHAIAAIVRRLHQNGHRRIAFLCGPADNPSANKRFDGYRRGLKNVGIPFDDGLIIKGEFDAQRGFEAVNEALARKVDFTALIAGNDYSAFGALRALKLHGIDVPRQIQLVGFDNAYAAPLADPPLTTFRLPIEEMAHAAVAQMTKLLKGESVPPETRCKAVLINRGSTQFTDIDPELDQLTSTATTHHSFDSEVLRLVETIPPGGALPDVLTASEAVFNQALRRNLNLDTVVAAITARAGNPTQPGDQTAGEHLQTILSSALSLTLHTTQVTEARAIERNQVFQALTFRLRHLGLKAITEDTMLDVLKATFDSLGFKKVRLYIKTAAPKGEERENFLHRWDFPGMHAGKSPARIQDVQSTALELSAHATVTYLLPLIANDSVMGNLIIDDSSMFSDDIPDLVRNVAATLHSVRLYLDLNHTNENLRETQRELVEASRLAGIAEVATGVLHNIGNALNSVNVSAGFVSEKLRSMKIETLARIEELLVRETETWSPHFVQETRGQQVVTFVNSLKEHLQQVRTAIQQEVQSLRDGVDHVNQIVAAQQKFADVSGLVEEVEPSEPVEYALRLCETELLRHNITVIRDYSPAPSIQMERHKAVQILVNLIRNAKEALSRSERTDKQIRAGVRTSPSGRIQCFVTDNGVGISPEALPRIFTMGFTTKQGGHGFGLHNSALTAMSLGGKLEVQSDGINCGATFLFTLPQTSSEASPKSAAHSQ